MTESLLVINGSSVSVLGALVAALSMVPHMPRPFVGLATGLGLMTLGIFSIAEAIRIAA